MQEILVINVGETLEDMSICNTLVYLPDNVCLKRCFFYNCVIVTNGIQKGSNSLFHSCHFRPYELPPKDRNARQL